MTTNKVHDPKNTECQYNKLINGVQWGNVNDCTCEKQQQAPREWEKEVNDIIDGKIAPPFTPPQEPTPTSVTGEEWEEALISEVLDDYLYEASMEGAGDEKAHLDRMRGHFGKLKDFIRNLLSTQRTQITLVYHPDGICPDAGNIGSCNRPPSEPKGGGGYPVKITSIKHDFAEVGNTCSTKSKSEPKDWVEHSQ